MNSSLNSQMRPRPTRPFLNRACQLPLLPAIILFGAILASNLPAQTLKLKFGFDDAGATTTDSVAGVVLNMVNSGGAATDLHGAAGTGVAGLGQALDLTSSGANGTGNIVSTVDDPALGFGAVTSWAATEWVKPNAAQPNLARFFIIGDANTLDVNNSANSFAFAAKNNKTSCQVYINKGEKGSVEQTLAPPLPVGGWTFIAYVYDGTNLSLYSGSDTSSATLLGSASYPGLTMDFGAAGNLYLGNRSSNGRSFQGYIDDTRFYTGTVSAAFVENVRLSALAVSASDTAFSPASPVYVGTPVTINSTVAGGTAPYTYDWQQSTDGGATYSNDLGAGNGDGTYNLDTSSQGDTTYYYRLIVTDSGSPAASITNAPAALLVSSTLIAPTLLTDTTITPSTTVASAVGTTNSTLLSAGFSGTSLNYQWLYTADTNGLPITSNVSDATTVDYTLNNLQISNTGYYQLMAYNDSGTNFSSWAYLSVVPPIVMTDAGATTPIPNANGYDIAQLDYSSTSVNPAGLYSYNDHSTGPVGQTFTTGGNPNGYSLASLFMKFGVTGNNGNAAGFVNTLRIYSLTNAYAGTATLLSTYTNQVASPAFGAADGHWLQWYGPFTNVLAPNSVYAFAFNQASGHYMMMDDNSGDPYSGGQQVNMPAGNGTPTWGTASTYDLAFMLSLVPAGGYPGVQNVSMTQAGAALTNGSTVIAGTPVTLNVTAFGSNIGYVWQTDNQTGGGSFSPLPNSSTSQYSLDTSALTPGTYQFNVQVTNSIAANTSMSLTLMVQAAIIQSVNIAPANSSTNPVYAGTPVTLSATVEGANLTYTWQTDGGLGGGFSDIPNSNTNVLTLNTSSLIAGTYQYQLRVSNSSGMVASLPVTLNLAAASGPVLVTDTAFTPSAVLAVGNNVTLSAVFTGSQPITYQWYFTDTNGAGPAAISGATNNSFTLSVAQLSDAGTYYVTAANNPSGLGTQTANSTVAPLYVVPAAQNNTTSASISDGGTSPYVGDDDISQLADSAVAPPNPPINYYVDAAMPPGQIFTTGPTPPAGYTGFPLSYIYVKQDGSVAGPGNATAQTYTLRVYQMLDSTNAQLLTSYVTTNTVAFTTGDWLRVGGLTNLLQPNTTYAFSIARNVSSYWRPACTVYVSPGPNGQAAALPVQSGAAVLSSPDPTFGLYYDAAFVAGLTPPTAPVVLADTTLTPNTVFSGQGPVTMQATFTGQAPISYQWQLNGVNVPGATNTTYTIPVANYTNAGSYTLTASNALSAPSFVSSTPVYLTVAAPPTTSFVANFAYWNTHPGAASPGYSGPGVIGTGTAWNRPAPGTATDVFNGTTATLCQNPAPAVADDGSDLGTLSFSAYATKTDDYYWYASVPSGEITLLDTFMDNQSTNAIPFAISNAFNGVYNLVLFGENGRSTSAKTTFTINGLSQTITNTSASLNQFVLNDNYAVFYDIPVTNGTISGTWSNPDGSTTATFNGAQLQMAYSADNPQIFIALQPVSRTNLVGATTVLTTLAEAPGQVFYQWFSNSVPVLNATNSTYSADTSTAGTYSYYVVVTNSTALPQQISSTATLTISTPNNLVWDGAADTTTWDYSTGNWFNTVSMLDGVAFQSGDYVVFDDSTVNNTVTLSGSLTPTIVTVNNTNQNYVFTGTGSMTGSMSLTKNGSGTLTVSNNNNYAGGTAVNDGTLVLAKGGSAGAIAGAMTINPGATVSLMAGDALGYGGGSSTTPVNIIGGTLDNATTGNEGYITSFNLTGGTMSSSGGGSYNMNGASAVAINSLASSTLSTVSAPVALRSDGMVISTEQGTVPGGIDLEISGPIKDAGGRFITKTGPGTLLFSGVNTFNGNITISDGTLIVGGNGLLNSGAFTATLINNGIFKYAGSGAQALGPVSGVGELVQNGPGQLTVNGAMSYTGNTTVNAGTLDIVQGPFAANSTVTVADGAVLQLGFAAINTVSNLVLNGVSQPPGIYNSANGAPYITGTGSLQILSAGPGVPATITNSVSGNTLSLSWPAGQGWRLQMQTNGLSAGLSANWIYVTDGTVSSTNITVNPNTPTAFYRLVYP